MFKEWLDSGDAWWSPTRDNSCVLCDVTSAHTDRLAWHFRSEFLADFTMSVRKKGDVCVWGVSWLKNELKKMSAKTSNNHCAVDIQVLVEKVAEQFQWLAFDVQKILVVTNVTCHLTSKNAQCVFRRSHACQVKINRTITSNFCNCNMSLNKMRQTLIVIFSLHGWGIREQENFTRRGKMDTGTQARMFVFLNDLSGITAKIKN